MAGGTILDYLKYDFSKRDCLPLVFQSRLNEDRCFGFDWALRRKRRIRKSSVKNICSERENVAKKEL